jgi:hypothetical protein
MIFRLAALLFALRAIELKERLRLQRDIAADAVCMIPARPALQTFCDTALKDLSHCLTSR